MARQQAAKPAGEAKKVAINIAPVELPDYLNRLQIVTRDGRNELKLAEFDRWAGSLAENIGGGAGGEPGAASRQRTGHSPTRGCSLPHLTTRWQCGCCSSTASPATRCSSRRSGRFLPEQSARRAVTRISSISEKLGDKQYATLAAAVSRTLEQLSGEIAREIQSLPAERK